MKQRIALYLTLGTLFFCFAAAVICLEMGKYSQTPVILSQDGYIYTLQPGATIKSLAKDLDQAEIIKEPGKLIWLARARGLSTKLQAGEYEFDPGLTPNQLLDQLANGKVIQKPVTLIEGWTFEQMLTALAKQPYLQHTLQSVSKQTIMQELGFAEEHPEGLFFPDTYLFAKDTTDKQVLQNAYQRMQNILNHEWADRSENLPYTDQYQALIAASLIEKETAVDQERYLIAGVLVNRLLKKMPLQFDPTVIYALGENYSGKLSSKDLRFKSPYNTYVNKGLPPTPIAMPGRKSIHAALHPSQKEYYYFVAKGDGTHYFSVDLKEHENAVRRYRQH